MIRVLFQTSRHHGDNRVDFRPDRVIEMPADSRRWDLLDAALAIAFDEDVSDVLAVGWLSEGVVIVRVQTGDTDAIKASLHLHDVDPHRTLRISDSLDGDGEPRSSALFRAERTDPLSRFHASDTPLYTVSTAGTSKCIGIFSGSFHPLHAGHEELRIAAERHLGGAVTYELPIHNADKRSLDPLTLSYRVRQFQAHPLLLTRSATFPEKAELLPGSIFIVGYDTAIRILDERYYPKGTVCEALRCIRANGCRFLVAGRLAGSRFLNASDFPIPSEFRDLFDFLPAAHFRNDSSSTENRRGGRSIWN